MDCLMVAMTVSGGVYCRPCGCRASGLYALLNGAADHAEHPREDSEMSMERVLTMVAVVLGSVALVGCQPKEQEKVELPAAPVEQIAVEAEAVEAAVPAVPEQPPADKP